MLGGGLLSGNGLGFLGLLGLLDLLEATLFALRIQAQASRVDGGQVVQAGALCFDDGGAGTRLANLLSREVFLGGSVTVGVVDVGGSRAFLRGALRTDGAQVLFKLGASILGGVG